MSNEEKSAKQVLDDLFPTEESYNNAEGDTQSREWMTDGKYVVRLVGLDAGENHTTSQPWVVAEVDVVETLENRVGRDVNGNPTQSLSAGTPTKIWLSLESNRKGLTFKGQKNFSRLKAMMAVLYSVPGVHLVSPSQLTMQQVKGPFADGGKDLIGTTFVVDKFVGESAKGAKFGEQRFYCYAE